MKTIKPIIMIAAVLVLLIAIIWRMNIDSRYNGWSRYTDKQDHYEVLVPPGWKILEETSVSGLRGSRVFQREEYPTDLGTLTVFTVYARDLNDQDFDQQKLRSIAEKIAKADLKEYSLEPVEAQEPDVATFDLTGTAFIENIKIEGKTRFMKDEDTLLIISSLLPDERKEELAKLYGMIHESVRFVEVPEE